MEIKDIQGNILIDALVTESAVKTEELMKQDSITLSWKAITAEELPVGSYVIHNGVRYSLLSPYRPQQLDEVAFEYRPEFHHPVMRWQHLPFFFYFILSANAAILLRWMFFNSTCPNISFPRNT